MSPLDALMAQYASLTPGGSPQLGGSLGGAPDQVQELLKALTASNYETDVANLTNGGALGIESLDRVMKATVQEQEHFVLFKLLGQTNATNIVDQWVRKNNVGGHLGGSTNSQMGTVRGATGEYNREIGLVKFLMTLRQVGYVGQLVNNVADMTAEEEMNGSLQLMTDIEHLLFNGHADACPSEFDSIFRLLDKELAAGTLSGDHVIDMQAAALTSVEPFTRIGAAVSKYGSWGKVTDTLLTLDVQTDLNNGIDPAFRWSAQPSNVMLTLGTQVDGIRLQNGVLKTHQDTFLPYDDYPASKPFQVTWSAIAAANDAYKPSAVDITVADDTASQFTAPRAGNYYWAVAGIGPTGQGQSTVLASSQTAVAAGKKASVAITASTGASETGYAIYRSRLNGTNTPSDMRLVCVVAKSGATTTYVDLNRDIPGTTRIPLLNLSSAGDAIGWRQFQPMTKIPLPFGIGNALVYSWYQLLFGYLRVTKPKHHGYIKNILPTNASWRPFN